MAALELRNEPWGLRLKPFFQMGIFLLCKLIGIPLDEDALDGFFIRRKFTCRNFALNAVEYVLGKSESSAGRIPLQRIQTWKTP